MKRMAFALLTCAAMLGACDNDRPAPAPGSDVAAAGTGTGETSSTTAPEPAPEMAETPTPDPTGSESPAPEPTLFNLPEVPADDVAEDRAALTAIPARFLGQWDAPDGPCAEGSEMFMTIRPGTITFYESQGEVTAVRRGRPGIVVTLAMQGEGESWTSEYAMSLVRNSEQLATRVVSDSGTGTIRRRCPPASSTTGAGTSASGGS